MCFDSQLGLWQQGFLKEQNLFLLSFGSFSRRQWLIISSNKTTTTNVFTLPFPIFDYSTLHPPAKVEFTRCDSLSSFSVASWGRQSIGPGVEWNCRCRRTAHKLHQQSGPTVGAPPTTSKACARAKTIGTSAHGDTYSPGYASQAKLAFFEAPKGVFLK